MIMGHRGKTSESHTSDFPFTKPNLAIKTMSRHCVYNQKIYSNQLESFVSNPDRLVESGVILKDGDTTTVVKISLEGRALILKRYNIVGFWQSFRRLFQVSKASSCCQNASRLLALGISTPMPYAFLEERILWVFRRRAFLITELIDQDNLLQQLEQTPCLASDEQLVDVFQHLFRVLQEHKISHGDMKATNFILQRDKLYVLDLDGMKQHRLWYKFRLKAKKDMNRFMRNWQNSRYQGVFEPMVNAMQHRITSE